MGLHTSTRYRINGQLFTHDEVKHASFVEKYTLHVSPSLQMAIDHLLPLLGDKNLLYFDPLIGVVTDQNGRPLGYITEAKKHNHPLYRETLTKQSLDVHTMHFLQDLKYLNGLGIGVFKVRHFYPDSSCLPSSLVNMNLWPVDYKIASQLTGVHPPASMSHLFNKNLDKYPRTKAVVSLYGSYRGAVEAIRATYKKFLDLNIRYDKSYDFGYDINEYDFWDKLLLSSQPYARSYDYRVPPKVNSDELSNKLKNLSNNLYL